MSRVPKSPALPAQERLRRSVVQTIDEQTGRYDSEGGISNQLTDSARFHEPYGYDHERSSRSADNRQSPRRDHWENHTHSTHAPSSVAYPSASVFSQQPPYDGQNHSYMEPRGGHLRRYNATAPYNPAHASHVAGNAGLPYHAYHASNPHFTTPGYLMNPNPPMSYHAHLHGENHSYPAGAYYAADHQHHPHRTGNIHLSDDSGHMRTRGSIHSPPSDLEYGSSMPNISEAERMRRDLEAFQLNTMDPPQRVRGKDKERQLEKEKRKARNIKREERAQAKQREKDKKEADEMKGRIAHLTQQLAEIKATMYQEKQKKETTDREMLQDSRRMPFENRLRDFGHLSNTQTNVQSDRQQLLRQHHGTEQMLQQIISFLERLWGEENISRSDLGRLAQRGILASRPPIDTDHSGSVHRWVDTNMQREVEEMVVNFLKRLYSEDTYEHGSDPPLALRQGSSASDYNSKAGSSSSRTAINMNSINEDPLSPKFNEFWSHLRPSKNGREKHHQKSQSQKSNSSQKPSSMRKGNRGPQPSASEDSEYSNDDSSDDELKEIGGKTDSDDYDSSSSEVEEPRRRARGRKRKNQKTKRGTRVSRKLTQSKHRSEEPSTRGHAAYVKDEIEEGQDEWKRKKPSRYVYAPPPAPSPPH